MRGGWRGREGVDGLVALWLDQSVGSWCMLAIILGVGFRACWAWTFATAIGIEKRVSLLD